MLDFYKKTKTKTKTKKNTECQLTVTKNMLITLIDIMSDLDTYDKIHMSIINPEQGENFTSYLLCKLSLLTDKNRYAYKAVHIFHTCLLYMTDKVGML